VQTFKGKSSERPSLAKHPKTSHWGTVGQKLVATGWINVRPFLKALLKTISYKGIIGYKLVATG